MPRPSFVRLPTAWLAMAFLAALLSACGGSGSDNAAPEDLSPAGPQRTFALGFSALPGEASSAGYRRAFEIAGAYGELILVQRTVPWDEFLPGDTEASGLLRDTTKLELRLADREGLDFVLAIDLTDPKDRHRLAPLPEELRGKDFSSDELRRSYLAYIRYMAANYQPRYMALAVEVNLFAGGNPSEFDRFLPVYRQAYDIVKDVSPATNVFVTFQYEDLLGELPWNRHDPDWDILERFGDRLDLVALSTYPSLLDRPIQDLPASYYAQLSSHTGLPIAIADMGYSSGPGANGVNVGSEAEQLRFLQQVMGAADRLQMVFVVWFAALDPAYVLEPPLDVYATVGLHSADGEAKAGWNIWIQNFRRPYGEGVSDTPAQAPKRRNPIATAPPEKPNSRPGSDSRDPFRDPPAPPGSDATTPSPTTPRRTPTPIS